MGNELKGRYAIYYTGNKPLGTVEHKTRLSLNQVKVNFGADIARAVVEDKLLKLGSTHWFELELLPGEKDADEIAREKLKREIVKALYLDLQESYPKLTYAWLLAEADNQLAGAEASGGPGMYLNEFLVKSGLLKEG